MKEVIVIGGGFAGVNFAKKLAGKRTGYHITLVDRNNYNFFPPLLYQLATGFLDVSNISYPFRKLIRHKDVISFWQGNLEEIDILNKTVSLSTGKLSFDILVIATGAESNYFGMENVKKNALPMKTVDDAIAIRNHFLTQLECASREKEPQARKKLLNIVIAGGGPTGVEIAGMMAQLRREVAPSEYPEIPNIAGESRICLVDGLPSLLAPMSKEAQEETYAVLQKLGVEIILNKTIKDFSDDTVLLSDGTQIESTTLIWAAGVIASKLNGIPKEAIGKGGRILVDAQNQLIGIPGIYAIGDTCFQQTDAGFPNGHPQLAQVAIQQGRTLANNLEALEKGTALEAFKYNDKGSMAIIGRNKAVADLTRPKIHLKGFIAYLAWLFVHLFSLITFNNKIKTLYNWIVMYFTRNQSLRLIIGDNNRRKLKSS